MNRRINLNPKELEKNLKRTYEDQIIVGIFILCIVSMMGFIGNEALNYRSKYVEKQNLEMTINGLNFSQNNVKLNNEIKEKNSEIDFLNKIKNQKNYYKEVYDITQYIPTGISLTNVQATGDMIKIEGTTSNKALVPMFLESLKKSKEYKEAFLKEMQTVDLVEETPSKELNTTSKEQVNLKTTPSKLENTEKTIFSIMVGGESSEPKKQD